MMKYWIWLSQIPSVGPIFQKKLLQKFEQPENIYRASMAELLEVGGIGKETARKIHLFRIEEVLQIIRKVEQLKIEVLPFGTEGYDEVFSCKQSPVVFYYRGKKPVRRGVAVVGARRCTEEAKRIAADIARVVAESGVVVVSGMAKGVDGYAHTACMKSGGCTVAVLASGVDICYPKEHRRIYEQVIATGGTVLSAYPPGVKPHPKFFLERNAHISAWSTDVVVVQAAEKSGSLTTARFALEQGRNLYAVPHSIYLLEAKGSNQLLAQGASPYLGATSFPFIRVPAEENDLPLLQQTEKAVLRPHSPLEKEILTYLSRHQPCLCPIDELSSHLALPELELTPTLIEMEMSNLIKIQGRGLTPLVDIPPNLST